jgi:hypothetical protein
VYGITKENECDILLDDVRGFPLGDFLVDWHQFRSQLFLRKRAKFIAIML